MINFSIAVIAKNEAKTLPRLIASLKEFQDRGGEIAVLDTGSTDGTPEIACGLGCRVTEVGDKFLITIDQATAKAVNKKFIVDNEEPIIKAGDKIFDYSAARNHAASLCSNDMVAMPDCDEAYTKLDLDKVCAVIASGATQLEYNFVFSHDNTGKEVIKFLHCKFYDRRKLSWTGIIHEIISGPGNRVFLDESIIKLEHWQNYESNRGHYLPGLAYDHWLRPDYDRNAHYFGRELLWHGRYKSAIKQFERHIKIATWPAEAAQSTIFIGQCYGYMGNEAKQVEYYLKAMIMDTSRREPLIQLCDLYRHKDDFQKVACFAEAALAIPWNNYYHNDMRHYAETPHAYLYWAYWYLGNHAKSKEHYEKALAYAPNDPQIQWDARVTEPWIAELPDGWFSIVDIREYRRLVEQVPVEGTIVELGCWKGRSICSIAEIIKRKNLSVVLVDTFQGTPGEEYAHGEAKTKDILSELKTSLIRFGLVDRCQVMVMPTNVAAEENGQFDLVFIDADHSYEAVKQDIANWKPKIKAGGILAGHDYLWEGPRKATEGMNVHPANNIWSVQL